MAVDPERTEEPVRSFGAFTRDPGGDGGVANQGRRWNRPRSWIPVYETREVLVPPRMTKQIGGRKSDVLDCQWIWQLMSYGLLRGAFRRATRFARCAPTHAR